MFKSNLAAKIKISEGFRSQCRNRPYYGTTSTIHNGGLPGLNFRDLSPLEYNQKVVKNELRVVMATLEIQIDLN